jgi:hypothetical protein
VSQPIKRYRITGYESISGKGCTQEDVCPDGDWVDWKDYAALAAENERLRKAGDDLMGNYYATCLDVDGFNEWPSVKAWLAAKEGRDAK